MRLIGYLSNEAEARQFADFLYSQRIESRMDPASDGRWEVWIIDDMNVETAKGLLGRFSLSPDDPTFRQAARAAAKQRQRDEKEQTPKRVRFMDGRTIFYTPPVPIGTLSIILIIISVVVAVVTNLGENHQRIQPIAITQYMADGQYIAPTTWLPEIRRGQIWRLFTPMFLHFGILHLFFNMLWLRDLGSMIEARKSPWMLLLLVLVFAGTSNVAQYLYSGPIFGGMSGVVYGLLGYMWMQGKFNPASGLSLQPQTVTMMIVWFFLCLTGLVGHVANTAHAVGAVAGIIWGFLAAQLSVAARRR